jgi:5-methylthioadenosine/S-adenosylhomocysteine deaminase
MTNEILCKGGFVLSMDPDIGDLPKGDVHIADGRIVRVGVDLEAPNAEVIDAAGKIVLPGLVDGHRHVWQSTLRGVAADWTLPQYLVEARSMYCGCFDAEDAYLGNYLGGVESIAAGITTVVDHSHLQKSPEISDALVRGLSDSGVAGFFCYGLQNELDFMSADGGVNVDIDVNAVRGNMMRAPDEWHDANARRVRDYLLEKGGLLRFGIALPDAASFMPAEIAASFIDRARNLQPEFITGHWDAMVRDGHYISNLADLHARGALTKNMAFTHGNHLNDDDCKLLAGAGVGLCTTPDTECGMGMGPLQARRFVALGGAAVLGVDISSYVSADIFKQAYLMLQSERMSLAERHGHLPGQVAWRAREALEMATIMGARAIGMDDTIGSIRPGKRADLIVVAPSAASALPLLDPVASLLFYTSPADVETVLIDGKVRKRAGRLVGVDLTALNEAAARSVQRVTARFNRLPRDILQSAWAGMM